MLSQARAVLRRLRGRAHVETLSSLEAYARWAAAYPAHAHNAVMRAEEAAVLALMPPLDGLTVLDLACGTGRYTRIAHERRAACVFALDNSLPMLAQVGGLRALAAMDAVPLRSASVDVVLCGLAVGHLPRHEPVIHELARVLRRGGTALVSDVHPALFAHGALRTFQADGMTFAVEHYVHAAAAVERASAEAGMRVDRVAEPSLLAEDRRSAAVDAPVAIVYRIVKP